MSEQSTVQAPVPRREIATRNLGRIAACVVGIIVLLVTVRSQEPVGAGIYYDDGAYLALARSLAEGDGYVYSNLPGRVPGVKYPPAYPAALAAVWAVFDSYPENLGALKALNALLWGLAAAGTVLLFARGGRLRRIGGAAVTLYIFLTVPSMSIATVLLAEPLFLAACVAALLLTARDPGNADSAVRIARDRGRGAPPNEIAAAAAFPGGTAGWAVAAGLTVALAFLGRAVGVTLIAALLLPLLVLRRWRDAGLAALSAGLPAVAWIGWVAARAGDVPAALTGQYGSYGSWLGEGLGAGALGVGTVAANWRPFLETLQFAWIPRAPVGALYVVLVIVGVATAYGLREVWRRNPALAVFPVAYLALVLVWPYEPYRFYYAILPLLTLLAFEGLCEAVPRIQADLPRWGVPVGAIVLCVFAVNALAYHARGHAERSWATPQTVPARAYAPLNQWIRDNTAPGTVIGAALDPYVHWETGRPAVPSWHFEVGDYEGVDEAPDELAAGLDSVIARFGARYVVVVRGDNKAARSLESFVELHPGRARKLLETGGPVVGVIYEVAPPGVTLSAPEAPEAADRN